MVERNSLPGSAWEDPEKADQVLQAVDTRLDGRHAAVSCQGIQAGAGRRRPKSHRLDAHPNSDHAVTLLYTPQKP
ncbi:hypothetical protein ACF1A5_12425 [Streptomyces sp. NPDC014864]|uniref:hypothetical protein n=1 Tax=Streptomyces sp. NPDC014864 TaxID=3364924 RepID=UPI0036FF9553